MKRVFGLAALGLVVALSGCATTPQTAWKPRTDADLKADQADCKKQADSVDYRSAQAFSDGRYGAAAAIAARTNQSDLTGASLDRMYAAVAYVCMTDKGWMPAN